MAGLTRNFFMRLCLLSILAPVTCLAQSDVSISLGILKNFVDFNQFSLRGNSGELITNRGPADPGMSIQATFPFLDKLQIQTGIRALYKSYDYELRFEYPGKFALYNKWTSWGMGWEVPVHVSYALPKPILKRNLKVSAGFAFGHNRIYELSSTRRTEILATGPSTLVHRFETELNSRKKLLTPALEAGFEFGPLLLKNIGLRGTLHYDLLPAFGNLEYLNYYQFEANGKVEQGYPQGTLRADDTGYFMLQLNYKLPVGTKKKKAA